MIGASVALVLGSFGDEAAQVAFALRLTDDGDAAPARVSALLAAGLLGGISAGLIAPRVIARLGARRLIGIVFVAEAVLIAAASLANTLPWYLAVAAALGCLGALLWSAVLVILPDLHLSEAGVARANRVVQSARNLGYVIGPLAGSALYAWSSGTRGLLALAGLMVLAAASVVIALPRLVSADVGTIPEQIGRRTVDIGGLLRTQGVLRALAPLIVTVMVTSALNVLLIVRVRLELDLSAGTYGGIVAALSAGLVIGPVLVAGFLGRRGEARGAAVGAALIGIGIVAIGSAQQPWQLVLAAAIVGVANGGQNTLMTAFMIKRIAPARRTFQMPAYVLILQVTVFLGFVSAAFIHVDDAGTALVVVGVVAVLAGTSGALLNRSNTEKPTGGGDSER